MASKALRRGDIVLVPFPFTDLSGVKVRPAVIISPDPQEIDILLAFISSVIPSCLPAPTEFLLESNHIDFPSTGLKTSSLFKMKKLVTIEIVRVGRRIGRVSTAVQTQLDVRLRAAVGLTED